MPGRIHRNWLRSYMRRVSKTEPSSRYHLWVAIMMLATSLGRKCEVRFGPETFFPNFYTVLVGPPGARKGTAIKYGVQLLKEVTTVKFAPEAITRQQFFAELEKDPRVVQFDNGDVLAFSSMLVVAPELAVFMGDNDPQRLADLCDMYDGRERFEYKTKTSGSNFIANPSVWILGATTPSWIEACMPHLSVGGGLASRIVFVYAPGRQQNVPLTQMIPFDQSLEAELVHDLAIINNMKGIFTVTEKADTTYAQWYIETYPTMRPEDPRLLYFMDRMPSMVAKLAMVLSAAQRDDMVITDQDILAAVNMFNALLPDMPLVFGGMGMNILGKQMMMVQELVMEREAVPKSLIMKSLRMHINEYDYQRIKMTLLGQKFLRVEHRAQEEWLVLVERRAVREEVESAGDNIE